MEMLVPRFVRKIPEKDEDPTPLESLRNLQTDPAWILLGEPGSGKTTALEIEAEATNGVFIRIDEFINADVEPDWNGKTLFLDGLDEARAGSGGNSVIQRICRQLKRLGKPAFRIACRAADWYGATDRIDFERSAPNGQISVLVLEPLNRESILDILAQNHGISDPHAFFREAEKRGVADLLTNPQTLELLTKAVSNHWPKTKDETYQLACEKLAGEANKRHRDQNRTAPVSVEKILNAAGQLCAVLLLSDKTGIALDSDRVNERFPSLDDFSPPDTALAMQALGSKLFRARDEERVEPSHRSIAEYLAAFWLGNLVTKEGLPLQRVLNLLLGIDGGVVSGLRGLFGWLALHCSSARSSLIDADPLTVVVYGDVKPMCTADKRRILAALQRAAENYPAFAWDIPTSHPFGALSDPNLEQDFLSILSLSNRDRASQAMVDCVIEILKQGESLPALAPALSKIVRDETYFSSVRKDALRALLKLMNAPEQAVQLLGDIDQAKVTDNDDELTGVLLHYLYPKHIAPETVLQYLHTRKSETLLGSYILFFDQLPNIAPQENFPLLMDNLIQHPYLKNCEGYDYHTNRMINNFLTRGIREYADQISNCRLFSWLGIQMDEHGYREYDSPERQIIRNWISERPERYKGLVAYCLKKSEKEQQPAFWVRIQIERLCGATPPNNIGFWYLEQAGLTNNNELAQMLFTWAFCTLYDKKGDSGLSLENIENWVSLSSERQQWLKDISFCKIDDWRIKQAKRKINQNLEIKKTRKERTLFLQKHLPTIRTGTARVDLMSQLAYVWKGMCYDVPGETLEERFNNYCDNGQEILAVTDTGLRLCPERADLPTVSRIISSNLARKQYYISYPCLVGMELRWEESVSKIEMLSDEILRRMIAFRLVCHHGSTPDWFTYLVKTRPDLIADALVTYTIENLTYGSDYLECIPELERNPDYQGVAIILLPLILEEFPISAPIGQLRYLKNLLKAALHYMPDFLRSTIETKLKIDDMEATQKLYWYAIATLLDPYQYEDALLQYIGHSETYALDLDGFLRYRDEQLREDYNLPIKTIGRIIELLSPNADVEVKAGVHSITDSIKRGDMIRDLINRLGAMATVDAAQELDRLFLHPGLEKLRWLIESARHQQKIHQRENDFRFLSPLNVAEILSNQPPVNAADLTALTLNYIDDIAREIRQENDDGFRDFWNIEKKKPISQREENLCRDALLQRLRARLAFFGIDCQPEGDYSNDKRADIRVSYHTDFEIPIEIKRDSHKDLWTSLRSQLIKQYSIAPRAAGHGIYLVFWFGGKGLPRDPNNPQTPQPQSPEELKTHMEAQLTLIERQRIFFRVIDVSWPNSIH